MLRDLQYNYDFYQNKKKQNCKTDTPFCIFLKAVFKKQSKLFTGFHKIKTTI